MADLNLPGHVRCTRASYNAEMTRIKGLIGATLPENWATTLTGDAKDAASKYANNIYFCEDTAEIFYREVCYGFSESAASQLEEIANKVFPLTVTVSGGNTVERVVGDAVSSHKFNWTIQRNGVTVTPDSVTVNGVSQTDKTGYAITAISADTSWNVVCKFGSQTVSFTLAVKFYYNKYYGALASNGAPTAAQILTLSKELAKNNNLATKTFNCSGGKYPVIVIPGVHTSPKVIVNGLTNTDITVTTPKLTLSPSPEATYTVIMLNNIQYGSGLQISVTA